VQDFLQGVNKQSDLEERSSLLLQYL